jgi:hypothetical protein
MRMTLFTTFWKLFPFGYISLLCVLNKSEFLFLIPNSFEYEQEQKLKPIAIKTARG